MIKKERLEELIEKGATIYEAKYNDVVPVSLTNEINCISWRYGVIAFKPMRKHKWLNHKYFKNLFETEEEAREHLEFGNITRTEKFPYTTWEDFQNEEFIEFYCYTSGTTVRLYNWTYNNHICVSDSWDIGKDFDGTKEGYLDALRYCVKLFKGEEV